MPYNESSFSLNKDALNAQSTLYLRDSKQFKRGMVIYPCFVHQESDTLMKTQGAFSVSHDLKACCDLPSVMK